MVFRFALILCLSMGLFLPFSTFAFSQEGPVSQKNTGTSPAQDGGEMSRKASSIARQTMSPFCPGRTLSDCPSEYAAEWRRDIRQMLEKGMSADEIQHDLEKRAGGNLSGIPNRESSYALPLVLATAAALLLYFVFVRLRRKDDEAPGAGGESKPEATGQKPDSGGATKVVDAPAVDDARLDRELESEEGS